MESETGNKTIYSKISNKFSTNKIVNEMTDFRKSFLKYESPTLTPSTSGSEASKVIMFETHTPGFCYHRDGTLRKSNMNLETCNCKESIISTVYPYVFTDNEVDPEKVIALHLLTIQILRIKCNQDAKKSIYQALSKPFKENEKSEFTNKLPSYSLESDSVRLQGNKENFIEIKLKNTKIDLLVSMIMEILNDINQEKYLKIIKMVNNKIKIIQLLDKSKITTLYELCEKSNILTEFNYYSIIDKNDSSDRVNKYTNIKKIYLPFKYITAERFISNIHSSLIYELQMLYKKKLMFPQFHKHKYKNYKKYFYDGLVPKVEFLEKTDTSFSDKSKAPRSNNLNSTNNNNNSNNNNNTNSSNNNASVNILKLNDDSFQKFATQYKNSITKEEREKFCNIFKRMNNSQRIRLGDRVAELKSKNITSRLSKMKTSIDDIMGEVLSKTSLENLLNPEFEEANDELLYETDENDLYTKCSTLEEYNKFIEKQVSNFRTDKKNYSQLLYEESNSGIVYSKIKQDIIEKETEKKIQKFLNLKLE